MPKKFEQYSIFHNKPLTESSSVLWPDFHLFTIPMLWNSFLLIYNYIRYFCCGRNLDNSVCDLAYVDREGEEQNCFFMAPFSPYQQKVSNDDWLTAEPAKCFLSSFSDLCYSRSTWRNWKLSQANCIFRSFREGRH